MKNKLLIAFALLTLVSCAKQDHEPSGQTSSTNGGNSNNPPASGSHECGYPKQDGTPCSRKVSGSSGYCWQHD